MKRGATLLAAVAVALLPLLLAGCSYSPAVTSAAQPINKAQTMLTSKYGYNWWSQLFGGTDYGPMIGELQLTIGMDVSKISNTTEKQAALDRLSHGRTTVDTLQKDGEFSASDAGTATSAIDYVEKQVNRRP